MSRIASTYEKLGIPYGKPALRFLRATWSRVVVAMLIEGFPDRTQGVRSELLHARVDVFIEELCQSGIGVPRKDNDTRNITGRELCVERLMREYRLIATFPLESGETEYRLTSDAIEALETVEKLGSEEVLFSNPRIEMIVKAIENTALLVNPDYEAGLRQRQDRLEKARKDLEDYVANGGAGPASDSAVRASVANVMDLLRQVPSDMRRVEEMLADQGRSLIEEFRNDERPPGEIVQGYLERSGNIFAETESGRVYADAMETLGNAQLNNLIYDDLKMIATSPALADFSTDEQIEVRRAWTPIRSGVEGILDQRRKSSRTIRNSLVQHDVVRDRELTKELKRLDRLVWLWAQACKRNEAGPLEQEAVPCETSGLTRHLYDPGAHKPPPPLKQVEAAEPADLQELLRQGGPMTKQVAEALAASAPQGDIDFAEAFNQIDSDLRRDVELCGLMQLATSLGIDVEAADESLYRVVSLDGEERVWSAPRIVIPADMRRAMERLSDERA